MVMWSACRQTKKATDVLNCSNWCKHVLSLYKGYIACGFPKELGRGDSLTTLHYAVTNTVNILMHTQAVVPSVEQLLAIEKLKHIHKVQDQREFVADTNRMHDSIKANMPSENGKSVLKGMNSQEKQNCVNKEYCQQSVKADCETNKDGEEYQY